MPSRAGGRGDGLLGVAEFELPTAGIDDDPVAVVELATEQLDGQRRDDLLLDGPLERAGTVDRIESLDRQELLGGVGQLELHLPFLEALAQIG